MKILVLTNEQSCWFIFLVTVTLIIQAVTAGEKQEASYITTNCHADHFCTGCEILPLREQTDTEELTRN